MIPAQYQELVLPSLRRLVKHQHQQDPGPRYEHSFLNSVADQLRWRGIDLTARRGPWTVGARWLHGAGRGGLPVIPLVQRADTVVMTDTWDEARRLAGLLNWCHAPSSLHSLAAKVPRVPATGGRAGQAQTVGVDPTAARRQDAVILELEARALDAKRLQAEAEAEKEVADKDVDLARRRIELNKAQVAAGGQ